MDYYWYLNQSGTYTVDGTDDKGDFQETMVRLFSLGLLHRCDFTEAPPLLL